mmetsp:Transcript_903/g.1295  ORF Transcript_903/g.1295 Transcript_903/m.1295 type:complete len:219 (-) Transcript_903:2140-2796(-)
MHGLIYFIKVGTIVLGLQLWNEGSRKLFFLQLRPIHTLEPRMAQNRLNAKFAISNARFRVAIEKSPDDGLGAIRDMILILNLSREDAGEDLGVVVRAEGGVAVQHLKDKDAQGPQVAALVVPGALDDFRRQVIGSTAQGICQLIRGEFLSESKVNNLQVSLRVQQQIFKFEIAVDDALGVEVVEAQQHASCIELCLAFWESLGISQVDKQLSAHQRVH